MEGPRVAVEIAKAGGRGIGYYILATLPVVLAVGFGFAFVYPSRQHDRTLDRTDTLAAFAAWDGQWYRQIATEGYSYSAQQQSSVAFYPLYPILAAGLLRVVEIRPTAALLAVSHVAWLGCLIVFPIYLRERFPNRPELVVHGLLMLCLFPAGFYFRMTYSESLFLLLVVLAMLGMELRWPAVLIAAIIGLSTATRSVGVALLPPFAWYLYSTRTGAFRTAAQAVVLLPVCIGGLLAFMAYQAYAFDDPLAFVKTQVHWNTREASAWTNLLAVVTLEPLRAVYDPDSCCYWATAAPRNQPLFNLHFANPMFFVFAVGCVACGVWRRLLTTREWLLAAGLLLIPYLSQAYRVCMASETRYASVVFPVYIVLAHAAVRAGTPASTLIYCNFGCFLCAYAILFSAWYWYY